MEYYGARHGQINLEGLKISFTKFREFFLHVYDYFEEKGDFKLAFFGDNNISKLMKPSPEAFLFNHLGNENVYPIMEYGYRYNKVTTFTMIEVLYKYIWRYRSSYDFQYPSLEEFDFINTFPKTENIAQTEFRNEINKYLMHLDDGYLLSEGGYIINLPEDGLGNLITSDLPERTSDTVTEQVETAIKMFFKYDSNLEEKRKSINILADILEPYRKDLRALTTKKHDDMIFSIVNNYGIRHNNIEQVDAYNKPIWYEWMFHYYLSTVQAALRLNKTHYK